MINFINKFNYQKFNSKSFKKFLKRFDDSEIVKKRRNKHTINFVNIPCAFDVEVSSFYDHDNEKTAIMYIWQLCINGICWYGRTYQEFWNMLECVKSAGYGFTKRLVFYVHNLSYEFNVLRKYMDIVDYFAINPRKPLYVVDMRGVEFRCSYHLSGYSLAYLGDHMLFTYPVKKAVGDLDYYKIRSPETELTRAEMGYCINDVRVVCNYIQERIERGQNLGNIELTKTGAVRKDLTRNCIKPKGKYSNKYINMMQQCGIDSIETYKEQKEVTQGGFTHSSAINTNKTFLMSEGNGVSGADIASDYPFQMAVRYGYPMGQPTKIESVSLEKYKELINKKFCIVARVTFENIRNTFFYDYYISSSKCYDYHEPKMKTSNGRVVSCAGKMTTTITEIDFDIILKTYEWDSIEIYDLLVYTSGYLPKPFVETVLKYYGFKTTLKGVKGREPEYMNYKEMVNSIYGCMLTDMVRPSYTYNDGEYGCEMSDIWQQIDDYNNKKSRTSAFLWGAYVTAFARQKLWNEAIIPMADKFVYADTDSCYALYDDDVKRHFEEVNEKVMNELYEVSRIRGIPLEKFMPKAPDGKEKPLGIWEVDPVKDFKTLGAKRYMTRTKEGKFAITVAGLSKGAVGYIEKNGGFDYFKNHMSIPSSDSGRITATYIDDVRKGVMTDYKGHKYKYNVRCGVHFEPSDYTMSMHRLFIEYLREVAVL